MNTFEKGEKLISKKLSQIKYISLNILLDEMLKINI